MNNNNNNGTHTHTQMTSHSKANRIQRPPFDRIINAWHANLSHCTHSMPIENSLSERNDQNIWIKNDFPLIFAYPIGDA